MIKTIMPACILSLALVGCSDQPVSPAMILTAQTACSTFGGLSTFVGGRDLNGRPGWYVIAQCKGKNTVIVTLVSDKLADVYGQVN